MGGGGDERGFAEEKGGCGDCKQSGHRVAKCHRFCSSYISCNKKLALAVMTMLSILTILTVLPYLIVLTVVTVFTVFTVSLY